MDFDWAATTTVSLSHVIRIYWSSYLFILTITIWNTIRLPANLKCETIYVHSCVCLLIWMTRTNGYKDRWEKIVFNSNERKKKKHYFLFTRRVNGIFRIKFRIKSSKYCEISIASIKFGRQFSWGPKVIMLNKNNHFWRRTIDVSSLNNSRCDNGISICDTQKLIEPPITHWLANLVLFRFNQIHGFCSILLSFNLCVHRVMR